MPRRKGATIDFVEFQLFRIARLLQAIYRKVDEMSEGQAALDAKITDVQGKTNQILEVVTAIVAKIQSSPAAPDLTTEIATLQGISDALASGTATADTAMEFGGFTVDTVTPPSGPSGTAVEIGGKGFGAVVAVYFGGQHAASFGVVSDTLIRATVASAGDGSGSVEVKDAEGKAASGTATFTNTDAGAPPPPPPASATAPGSGEAPPVPPPPGQ